MCRTKTDNQTDAQMNNITHENDHIATAYEHYQTSDGWESTQQIYTTLETSSHQYAHCTKRNKMQRCTPNDRTLYTRCYCYLPRFRRSACSAREMMHIYAASSK